MSENDDAEPPIHEPVTTREIARSRPVPPEPEAARPMPRAAGGGLRRFARRLAMAVAVVALLLGALVAVLVTRASAWSSKQLKVEPANLDFVDEAAAADRLARALRFRTVSTQERSPEALTEFAAMHAWLAETYPLAHSRLELSKVGAATLLFKWPGSDPRLKPILLMAHQDVVPAAPDTLADWEHPPFDGVVADGFVWGRGAIDDKANVLGILEAVERHLSEGLIPERTVYLSFGHDEEIGGLDGAGRVAEMLRAEGVSLEFVLDEGLAVTKGMMPGVSRPVALVGVAEKGYLTLQLSAKDKGGHSSMPPKKTTAGRLARAIDRVENAPMPAGVSGVVGDLFRYVGPEMSLPYRTVFANLWLFEPVVQRVLSDSPATNALLRTTTAVTMMQGSVKENILPMKSSGVVNFRIRPGDRVDDVVEHVRRAIDDPTIEIEVAENARTEASPVSRLDGEGFFLVQRTIGRVFPEAIVAPGLVLGATDSKHFAGLSDSIYRFQPQTLDAKDLSRIHGVNERISVEGHRRTIEFFYQLILESAT